MLNRDHVEARQDRTLESPVPSGISIVVPVHNGAEWLERVLSAIFAAGRARLLEVIAVDDGSTDGSRAILDRHKAVGRLTILEGERRGAAAALNLGVRTAAHALVAQIDQDVVIAPDWMEKLVAALDDPSVAAAQGHYRADAGAGLWSRVMALDLRQRYQQLGPWTNHVCTGNTIYRKAALVEVGLFDETLGYGYDNDLSYRLTDAGYRLAFRPDATSTHHWREGPLRYARQQYGFGFGRLDLVAKHRRRITGDDVSPRMMMLHGPLMALSLLLASIGVGLRSSGGPAGVADLAAAVVVSALLAERLVAGVRAALAFRDPAGLWFVPVHLVRDVAWAAAIGVWCLRRAAGAAGRPGDSMRSTRARASRPLPNPQRH